MSKRSFNASIIYVLLGLVFLAIICTRTISTPTIWTHLAQGRDGAPISYLEDAGSVNPSWLYDKVIFLTTGGNATLLILLNTLVVIATFILLLRVAGKWGGALSQGFALLIAGHLIFQGMDVGPQTFMMLFIAAFIAILSEAKKPALLFGALIPLQILWTNMNGSFLFGPFIALLAMIQVIGNSKTSRKKSDSSESKTLGILTVVLLLATLANPYTIRLHGHILSNLTTPIFSGSLLSDFILAPSNEKLVFFALILGAGGLITLKKRLPLMLTTLAIIGSILVIIRSTQTIMLFAVLSFPFLVLSFTSVGDQLSTSVLGKNTKLLTKITQITFVIIFLLSVIPIINNCALTQIGSASQFGYGAQEEQFANDLEELFAHKDFPEPEHTLNMAADGGYIAWKYNRKVFLYERSNQNSKDTVLTFDKMLWGNKDEYNAISDAYRPEAIIINTLAYNSTEGLMSLLTRNEPRWKLAYFDGTTAVLLLAARPELEPLYTNTKWQQAGLDKLQKAAVAYAEKVKKGCRAGNPAELIGAGKIFLACNRPAESKAIFELLQKGMATGNQSATWLGLGASQLFLKEFDDAVSSLKKATELSPESPKAWSFYAQAQKYAGNMDAYQIAVEKVKTLSETQKAKEAARLKKEQFKDSEKNTPKKNQTLDDIKLPE